MAEEHPQPDERPRPKYGELAPPGWVWKPPADQNRLDTARPVPDAPETAAPGGHPSSSPRPGVDAPVMTPGGHRAAGSVRWDVTLTILLIVFGFFGMTYSVGGLQALPASMQLLHSTNGLGDYTPAPVVATLVTAGSITMAGIWAVAAGLAVWLLARRKVAFYVPLVAGVVAFVALIVFMGIIVATDPVLLQLYSGMTPTPAPTPTPTPTAPPTTT